MDKEAIARVERADEILGEKLCALSATLPLFGFFSALENAETYEAVVAAKQALSAAILALQSSEQGEGLRETVKSKRRALGWSLRDLEAETGIGFSTLARFERGERIGNRVHAHLTEWVTLSPAEPSPESREGVIEECAKAVRRASERLGGVKIDRNGENLAVTLCSHFDDADGEQDEHGWTKAANRGCDETLAAIADHYAAAIRALSAPAHD